MKVSELIAQLQTLNQEAEVMYYNEDDQGYFPADGACYIKENSEQYVEITGDCWTLDIPVLDMEGNLIEI